MSTQQKPISYRYRASEIEISLTNPFADDKLDRGPFVRATADLLAVICEPFVVALNAPWGSGKTTTLRMLKEVLIAKGVVTAEFNAWKVDDATDPLVPLVASIHERLQALKGGPEADPPKDLNKLKTLGSSLARRSLRAAVRIGTAGIVDTNEIAEILGEAGADAVESASEGVVGDLIDAFKQERQASDEFRRVLMRLVEVAREFNTTGADQPPVVLMIDELDRCRPTFAVAMLERIKHFFDVPGLVFLLAIDLDQLKASTRKVYGVDLDAAEYLRRFIDLELRLPRARVRKMVDRMLSVSGADTFFSERSKYSELRHDREQIVRTVDELAFHFNLSHRVVQRMVSRLMLVLRQTAPTYYLYAMPTIFLIFLRMYHAELLQEFLAGRVSGSYVMNALRESGPGGEAFYQSKTGLVLEGDLLEAQRDTSFVKELLGKAEALKNSTDDAGKRKLALIDRLRNGGFSERIDLGEVMQRIDLVAMDLAS
jgi:hypothetical protein